MGIDNGDVCNILHLGIKYSESFYFIISFYSHFLNHFLWHNFYRWLYLFICPCFVVLTFVCSWNQIIVHRLHDVFLQLWKGEKDVGHSIFYSKIMPMLHIWAWTIIRLGGFDIIFGWKSFKVYHIGRKWPNPYCSSFLPYILIPIKNNESKVVKNFKRIKF
jgi:hypothetical protein